jgi:hypothetical protein
LRQVREVDFLMQKSVILQQRSSARDGKKREFGIAAAAKVVDYCSLIGDASAKMFPAEGGIVGVAV